MWLKKLPDLLQPSHYKINSQTTVKEQVDKKGSYD